MNASSHNHPTLLNLHTQVVHVLSDTTIIGRHEDCSLVLKSERGASRKHARITVENNIAVLLDLGSLNGTMVNGREISRAVQLIDGDTVIFDELEYRFISPSIAAPNAGDNVTVIANKDEIGRPEQIKPAIRVVEPETSSFDETESWELPVTPLSANTAHQQIDNDPVTAFPTTSRPGGHAPNLKQQQYEAVSNLQPNQRTKMQWSKWLIVIPLVILFMLAAFYFAYTAGFTAGNETDSAESQTESSTQWS